MLLSEVGGARLREHDLERGDALEPTEHDVLGLGMCDQAEAYTIEVRTQIRCAGAGIQELRELLLEIGVIARRADP